jgi:2-keto-4-pentenoate hydratase/2-oxohepta-3-ene-1,7-dioic acid hydratase in catechol pathway
MPKFGRFLLNNRDIFGYLADENTVVVARAEDREALGRESFAVSEGRLLPPVIPSKIIGVGLNYKAHAAEMQKPLPDEPLLFMKPVTAIIASGEEIVLPSRSERVDYEGELAVVIGKRCRHVSADEAKDYVLGYTCLNDVTARDFQKKDVQFTRAKGFDTFAPLGPYLVSELDPANLAIQTFVNGTLRQQGTTADLIFPVYELIAFVSSVMTLIPGDIITTGTPPGVGPLKPGDIVEVRIEGIGTLVNRAVAGI